MNRSTKRKLERRININRKCRNFIFRKIKVLVFCKGCMQGWFVRGVRACVCGELKVCAGRKDLERKVC